jgi:hypothetical protein
MAPLGIWATIMVTIFTAQFRNFVFSADTWVAIYVIAGFLVFAWLVKTVCDAYSTVTIVDLVEKIKNQENG